MHVIVTNCTFLLHTCYTLVWIKWVVAVLACLQGLGLRVWPEIGFHAEICRVSRRYRVSPWNLLGFKLNYMGFYPKSIGFHSNICIIRHLHTKFGYAPERAYFEVHFEKCRIYSQIYIRYGYDTETYVPALRPWVGGKRDQVKVIRGAIRHTAYMRVRRVINILAFLARDPRLPARATTPSLW